MSPASKSDRETDLAAPAERAASEHETEEGAGLLWEPLTEGQGPAEWLSEEQSYSIARSVVQRARRRRRRFVIVIGAVAVAVASIVAWVAFGM